MGNGQLVAWAYMSMSCGSPQPMTAMKVESGSLRRASGVMEAERVRRYSWHCWVARACVLADVCHGEKVGVWKGSDRAHELTPQKKWRTKMMRTRRATCLPV